MSFLKVSNLWMSYGDQVVLERINLDVAEGQFCTLVGASGCGKSTFLRLLLGQERPSKGRITLAGEPLRAEPDASRGIVFQKYSVLPHLTVLDNVALALELPQSRWLGRLLGQARAAAREEARAMLDQVGLGPSLAKYPHQLSGGMQQRLAIAQALMGKPRMLLLDEPFGALDPGIRKDMHHLLQTLWRQQRLTVFMVTHDLTEGFQLGTRLLVFDKVRVDPHAPQAYGAAITYDIPLNQGRLQDQTASAHLDRLREAQAGTAAQTDSTP